jgi:GNAT superfamily N-acetyltransferase
LIRKLYARGPHTTLYTPYCKIRDRLQTCGFLGSTDGHRLCAALAYSADTIEFSWAARGRRSTLQNLLVQFVRRSGPPTFLPLLEAGRRNWSRRVEMPVRDRCFRAVCGGDIPPAGELPAGYRFEDCEPTRDLPAAAQLMNTAYPSLPAFMTPERLQGMIAQDYYFSSGWFFLTDRQDRRVGLAISGYDREMDEGFIDWIELLPRQRRRGFGRLLITESLRRLPESRWVTVAGSLDAPFVVGDLYQRCGFHQTAQWSILGTPPAERRTDGRSPG